MVLAVILVTDCGAGYIVLVTGCGAGYVVLVTDCGAGYVVLVTDCGAGYVVLYTSLQQHPLTIPIHSNHTHRFHPLSTIVIDNSEE